MKTRVLSLALAVIMVVSAAAVFTLSAASEEVRNVKLTMGTAYAVAGATAMVDIYLSADELPADTHQHLRNWQFTFSGAEISGGVDCYVNAGGAFNFTNTKKNQCGNTSDKGYNCGTAEQFTCRGGWRIASIGFRVPADATGEIPVTISNIDVLGFEDEEINLYNVDNVTITAGKIVIIDALEGVVPAIAGAASESDPAVDYSIPMIADGTMQTKITKAGKLTGYFDTVVIPASIVTVAGVSLSGATIDKIVLKGTKAATSMIWNCVDNANSCVYYTRRANGSDTTMADILEYLDGETEDVPDVRNILQVYGHVKAWIGKTDTDPGEHLDTFYFGIAANDLDYEYLTIVVEGNGKSVERDVTSVYNTVTNVATNSEETAAAQGIDQINGKYIAALAIRGIPAGTYAVTLYGVTPDSNGNPIVVCSDTVNFTI